MKLVEEHRGNQKAKFATYASMKVVGGFLFVG